MRILLSIPGLSLHAPVPVQNLMSGKQLDRKSKQESWQKEGIEGATGGGLTAQLELSVDLLIGYIAHKERQTPGIPESRGQTV